MDISNAKPSAAQYGGVRLPAVNAKRDGSASGTGAVLGEDDFVVAVREHSVAVHAYLARRAGRQTADDLLAEVWLRAFRSRHNFDPAWDSPRPWLYGIARNTLRAHWHLHARPDPRPDCADDPWEQVEERSMHSASLLTWPGRWASSIPTTARYSCSSHGRNSRRPR